MNFIYVIHLMCWNYLIDLITDNRNRNSKNRSNSGGGNNKGGRAREARAPFWTHFHYVLYNFLSFLLIFGLIFEWGGRPTLLQPH